MIRLLLPLSLLLLSPQAQGQEWLSKPKIKPAVLDFVAAPDGCLASGTVVGSTPVSITRAAATAAYWDGAAWQTCNANTLRIAPEGLLVEQTRTQRYPTPSAPAAGTTASLGVGTWYYYCDGTGIQPISANTAVGTGWGTTSNGSVVTLTITTAGTAALGSVTGSLSRCNLEGTATSYTTTWIPSAAARNGDLPTIPVTLKGDMNKWCVSGQFQPRPNHVWAPATSTAAGLWQMGGSSGANTSWLTVSNKTLIFSVVDGAAVQEYQQVPMDSFAASHHFFTAIKNGAALSVYIDDRPQGTKVGTGTGIWSAAASSMAIGYRADGNDAFGGWVQKIAYYPNTADLAKCLALTWPEDSYRVATIGDSITFGAYATTPYSTVLMTTLGSPWLVANHGVNGDTTDQIFTRWTSTIRGLHYGTIVYGGGINSIRGNVSLATIESQTEQMLTEAAASGSRVIALSLLPAGGSLSWDDTKNANRLAYNTWLQNLCAANGWTFVDTARHFDWSTYGGTLGQLRDIWDSNDHLHPNDIGTAQIAAVVRPALPGGATCSAGAIAAPCLCGSVVSSSGYCCSGTWSSSACP